MERRNQVDRFKELLYLLIVVPTTIVVSGVVIRFIDAADQAARNYILMGVAAGVAMSMLSITIFRRFKNSH